MIKRSLIIFSLLTLFTAALLPILPLQGEEEIYDKTLRLHVLANSDSYEDQALKLKVRDTLLSEISEFIGRADTRQEAETLVSQHKNQLEEAAEKTVKNNGYKYDVKITLTEEYYPTREYDGIRLPAGRYMSLRVLIGKAEGRNWWCVLFPALCTSSAKAEDELKSAGFTSSQIKVLTEGESPRYKIKFRILEFFESIFG